MRRDLPAAPEESGMHLNRLCACFGMALCFAVAVVSGAGAQAFLNENWILDPARSHVYMHSEKLEHVFEKHQFTSVSGNVDKNGHAVVTIDLGSLETGIDLRNVRMRFLLFETFKFPNAVITADLDKAKLRALATKSEITYPLTVKVDMHGVSREIKTEVSIKRTSDTTVTVATVHPIGVGIDTFDFRKNLAKLVDAMGGIHIVPAASVSFGFTFVTGNLKPAVEAAQAQQQQSKAENASKAITSEGCETRFDVISQTGAIYFRTGSAELDQKSEPLLDAGADIAKRCASVRFEVNGYTDNVGNRRYNQGLSEDRAKSVVEYLVGKGVDAKRIRSQGYGETHPVASNDSEAGRAKNRRIEFKVKKE
jgi:outer membrane protein OmpA-like peptidoglycan-associated protein/polyisoprenoid-binding protein YceI